MRTLTKNFKKRLMFRRITAGVLAILFAACTILAPAGSAFAEEKKETPKIWIQVSPVNNRVSLKSGEKLTYVYNIDNIGSQKFTVRVYASPYHIVNESYDVDFKSETNRTQISRWMSFRKNGTQDEFKSEVRFTIEPGKRQSVEYQIAVPKDIPAGGQYASIVTEYVPTGANTGTGVQTVPRVNLLVYGTTNGDTIESVEVPEQSITGIVNSGNAMMKTLLKNTGNTDFTAKYQFKVESLFGKSIYEKEMTYDIFPDTSRRVDMEWENTPVFGIFKGTSTIKAIGQEFKKEQIILVIPVFVIIIIILLLTMLVVSIILMVKRRQAKKSRIVV